jgi:type IV secretory pathway component VirB8
MVAISEETGTLDEMLDKVAQYYDNEVDTSIRNLTTLLEPILLSFIFGIVLFLALAIFLPMWDLVKLVRKVPGVEMLHETHKPAIRNFLQAFPLRRGTSRS